MSKLVNDRDFYSMPGHLVRRCHQISVGLFHDECGAFDLTPIEFAIMSGVETQPGIDQIQLSGLVGVDRTTIGNVILRLEKRNLIERHADDQDRRVKRLFLSPEGKAVLDKARPSVLDVQEKLLAPLSTKEREQFVNLLTKIVSENNENSRVPLTA